MGGEWQAPTATLDHPGRSTDPKSALRLVVIEGPDKGRTLRLDQGTFTVGKTLECALALTDAAVSRRHFELDVAGERITLRDCGSKNGTHVGGVRLSECELEPGVVLRVGVTLLQLVGSGQDESPPGDRFGDLVGASARMREVFSACARVAPSATSVLIEGETGCGKELCAHAIHRASGRSGPLVICDLAGMTESLIESELFGHEKGAFTGADRSRVGAFMQAHGGTLFIDELGELDVALQPRLLRAIEERKVKPLGGSRYHSFDVRIVAATNRDLREEVAAGRFREDLYYRLAVVRIALPPLRDRKDDIPLLLRPLLEAARAEISPDALSVLMAYDWPGNVRELRNTIEHAVAMLGKDQRIITTETLGLDARGAHARPVDKNEFDFQKAREALLATWERVYVQTLLDRADGNVSRAARLSGVTRVHLHRLMKKHAIKSHSPSR